MKLTEEINIKRQKWAQITLYQKRNDLFNQ